MIRFITILLSVFFSITVQAADISETGIEDQQDDQELCVKQRTEQCLSVCNSTDDINCSQACDENAKNECLEAGE